MQLQEIKRVSTITKKEFKKDFIKTQRPVVIEHLIDDWDAYKKWNLSYIKDVAGEKMVPLYDDRPVKHDEGFNQAHATMKMSEYIDFLKKEPTNFRIFLYNLMKEVPLLKNDFKFPKIGLRLIKQIPMLFFGGEGSKVFMHHDIDWANILHFHFEGRKRVILFPPSETEHLYKVPYSLITREDIDFDNPDYEKFPALKNARGYVCYLNHGETLYMPEGYWHFMKYETPGFSMSLRALPRSFKHLRYALYNVFYMRHFDNLMRRRKGQDWIDEKNERALQKTNKNL
ncbi:cupin-like domain-containing protein [Dokdonia sp. Hel_I_53]|uniref:cupin-like domain-containing protein n=1 Tax=Dokdonia sp. Hel_I_53 TaxID=1566287 RepID=UPI00119C7959|nr:cupin-like domain-containing protein [Dokdonia sp. Hel_I_53]TVZ52423.1 Cupin-like domain-containing protein [Dokdonia sp. Hel_I_53]